MAQYIQNHSDTSQTPAIILNNGAITLKIDIDSNFFNACKKGNIYNSKFIKKILKDNSMKYDILFIFKNLFINIDDIKNMISITELSLIISILSKFWLYKRELWSISFTISLIKYIDNEIIIIENILNIQNKDWNVQKSSIERNLNNNGW